MSVGTDRERVIVLDEQMAPPPPVEEPARLRRRDSGLTSDQLLGELRAARTMIVLPIRGVWVQQLQAGSILWLTRLREMAIVLTPWAAFGDGTFGNIAIRRHTLNNLVDETWTCNTSGDGFDERPVMQPATFLSRMVMECISEVEERELLRRTMDMWMAAETEADDVRAAGHVDMVTVVEDGPTGPQGPAEELTDPTGED